ncbi:MAG: histidinol-phosphatase [Ancalomicrobiaceae bacterium]|nr:histidinol-phosphatase [Ancalomicrobiaceae bacterium]
MADLSDSHEFLAFFDQLADAAAEATLPLFRSRLAVENKLGPGHFDPVTAADQAAERLMRDLIAAKYPDHGVLGEEFANVASESPYLWVLDPIDGTRSFISGLPIWGTLIGLKHDGAPRLGMMSQPFIGERFIGDCRQAWYRGPGGERPLNTRPCARLADAVLMTTSPRIFPKMEGDIYDRIESQVRLPRYGADCYAYAMLAAGHVDLVIEAGLKPYDIVALIPVIEGAGGMVTTWDGGSAADGGNIVASGDPRLHQDVLRRLG